MQPQAFSQQPCYLFNLWFQVLLYREQPAWKVVILVSQGAF